MNTLAQCISFTAVGSQTVPANVALFSRPEFLFRACGSTHGGLEATATVSIEPESFLPAGGLKAPGRDGRTRGQNLLDIATCLGSRSRPLSHFRGITDPHAN